MLIAKVRSFFEHALYNYIAKEPIPIVIRQGRLV